MCLCTVEQAMRCQVAFPEDHDPRLCQSLPHYSICSFCGHHPQVSSRSSIVGRWLADSCLWPRWQASHSPGWSRQTVTQTLGLRCLVVLSAWLLHSQTALGTNKEYQTGSGQPLTRFTALGDQQLGEPKQGFARCVSGSMTLPKPPVTNDALPSQRGSS